MLSVGEPARRGGEQLDADRVSGELLHPDPEGRAGRRRRWVGRDRPGAVPGRRGRRRAGTAMRTATDGAPRMTRQPPSRVPPGPVRCRPTATRHVRVAELDRRPGRAARGGKGPGSRVEGERTGEVLVRGVRRPGALGVRHLDGPGTGQPIEQRPKPIQGPAVPRIAGQVVPDRHLLPSPRSVQTLGRSFLTARRPLHGESHTDVVPRVFAAGAVSEGTCADFRKFRDVCERLLTSP